MYFSRIMKRITLKQEKLSIYYHQILIVRPSHRLKSMLQRATKVCDVDLFCLQFVFVFWGERGISSVISILGVGEHFCLKTFLRLSNIRFLWKSAENIRGQCPPLLPGTPTAYGGM